MSSTLNSSSWSYCEGTQSYCNRFEHLHEHSYIFHFLKTILISIQIFWSVNLKMIKTVKI